jgi:hypothetical protein
MVIRSSFDIIRAIPNLCRTLSDQLQANACLYTPYTPLSLKDR